MKYGQMKIAIKVPGDYDNPQFNTWSVSCSDIAGKNGVHDPDYISIERVPSATGLELRERVRDVALSFLVHTKRARATVNGTHTVMLTLRLWALTRKITRQSTTSINVLRTMSVGSCRVFGSR